MVTGLPRVVTVAEQRAILLDLLAAIDDFCRQRSLTYFLYAGTLIGAVRHGGFIPWDDDLDIMMPRSDYEAFCRLFPRVGVSYLASRDTHPDFPYAYAKVCRAGTVMREPVHLGSAPPFGVNVDVIPFDRVPRSRLAWTWHRRLAMVVRAVLIAKVAEATPDLPPRTRLALRAAQAVLKPVPTSWLTGARTRVATLCRADTGHLGMLVASVPWRVPEHCLRPPRPHPFETFEAPVPAQAFRLLTEIYGDFMTLPPEAQRVSPHPGRAFWATTPQAPR